MLSLFTYKVIHFLGIVMIFLSLGGMLTHAINQGTREHRWRKQVGITHGLGLFFAVLGGFGMLARLGIPWPWPGWLFVKLIIWLILGGMVMLILRKPDSSRVMWLITIVLGVVAAYFGVFKPF
ncbi:MAG: hypothetical protein GWN00_32985 [Aliifodinibius sp.]|nr:hypothetical protein [candidate division Zixibacteria bacterium]NIT60851.1 hypothetical protein [Fodinibius sp.]NIW48890.1 hypothetical protein [Gammaproteobacteria bacterium]NIS48557.1 hypothetical protein [candidate division Zixibacteria bacterium]NIU16638.1 hypothetical protein [candidate division Zixibacteria bacterium]